MSYFPLFSLLNLSNLSSQGQCDCKDNVQGLACTECKDGYYFLDSNNPLGCDNCECNMDGVIGGLRICDKETGQCPCKLFVAGRKCTRCKPGFYGLEGRKVFGCTGNTVILIIQARLHSLLFCMLAWGF